jgi:hypothetical protein
MHTFQRRFFLLYTCSTLSTGEMWTKVDFPLPPSMEFLGHAWDKTWLNCLDIFFALLLFILSSSLSSTDLLDLLPGFYGSLLAATTHRCMRVAGGDG